MLYRGTPFSRQHRWRSYLVIHAYNEKVFSLQIPTKEASKTHRPFCGSGPLSFNSTSNVVTITVRTLLSIGWSAISFQAVTQLSCHPTIFTAPQTKFAKGMFSQVSVCPHGGVCPIAYWDTHPHPLWDQRQTPPEADTSRSRHPQDERQTPPPLPPWSRHPLGSRQTPRPPTPQKQTPPLGADALPLGTVHAGRCGATSGRYASYFNANLLPNSLFTTYGASE